MPQPLPSKEASLFRSVIRYYEDKQYKRGLKSAELILKKHPKHGDTTAMKALILNAQGKTEEAFALGKEALTMDMKSHICWHVYGLLHRATKNFEEAIKAYKFALRLESESSQIQRDLAILQIQCRDYQGYIQSRTAMLQAKPQLRQSWTALAIAQHLSGNPAEAEKVMTTYEGTLKTTPSKFDVEHSEAIMYKNFLIAEQGDYERALEHLNTAAKQNLDRLAENAAEAYRALLDRNSEHPHYYEKLLEVLEIPKEDIKARKAIYDEYAEKSPRCDAARRLPLDFLTGDDFKQAAEAYLTLMLNKGVPSTFANLKHLYSDSFKKDTLRELAEKYLSSQNSDASSKDKGEAAGLYYLAQHYNYHLSRDLAKATEYIDKAIEKDPKSAAETMDRARKLDLKDRYINTKAAKYQLRNNQNEKALKTVGLFTRAETVGGPLADLLDMQSIWFLTEDGEAYARQGNIGLALKRFQQISNIFDVWHEDQFDFHSFSLRKGQIRAYVDMIRWEDHVRDHPFFSRAALDAIEVYLKLADKPSANGVNGAEDETEEDALAKKKAAKKAKKEQQRLEREAAERQAKQDPNKGAKDGEEKKKDDDPLGLKLAETTDPLGEAMKFVTPLLQFSPKNIDAQFAGFEVYMRRKKYVLALHCLTAALALDPKSPRVHEQTVAFQHLLNTATDIAPKVLEVLKAEFKAIEPSTDLVAYNEEFLSANKSSPRHVLSAIKAQRLLGQDKAKSEEAVSGILEIPDVGYSDAIEGLEVLKSWKSSQVEAFKKAALAKFPDVTRLA
ncbi:hypothetical protein CEP52_009694 [Fusarium oligoseptatum]|uniref:Acetyltransferase n=1 Tax=Fusarium oligoseptatum TaxID=2604345 RepID=A0A428TBW3_9HYPO|nr:hypothetical protein CEP52_009694 [Fusarium oligoseptatum]